MTQQQDKNVREGHLSQFTLPVIVKLLPVIALTIAIVVCLWGMQVNLQNYMTPAQGMGYALGILGGSMMLALLLYPLRKRFRRLAWMGATATWFRIHMVLGILGPTLILFHSQFTFGSTNAAMALAAMLIVAASGLVGRYLYTRIHYGLFGARATLRELELDSAYAREYMLPAIEADDGLCEALRALEDTPARAPHSVAGAIASMLRVRAAVKHLSRQVDVAIDRFARTQPAVDIGMMRRLARAYFVAITRASGLQLFERLFRAWHFWHLPLFIMLIVTAIIHIVAVHMF
ncbi:MAG: hypothetical protein H6978_10825 [Gammaproteobacteria bacterium]|nr:hypothetical protein [Gammaproteobacteria bacterium]